MIFHIFANELMLIIRFLLTEVLSGECYEHFPLFRFVYFIHFVFID